MSKPARIGETLQAAALISSSQIEVALRDQFLYPHLRLGEILALRGWIKAETADFFGKEWSELLQSEPTHPVGYFLQKAALLNEQQIGAILKEQKQLGLKFGAVAVLRGYLKQKTVDFFIQFLFPQQHSHSPWTTFPNSSAKAKKAPSFSTLVNQVNQPAASESYSETDKNGNKTAEPPILTSYQPSSAISLEEIVWLG